MVESTFKDSVRERKSLVASARHRVCGSKSKRCSLPSDNLTPAQRNKLNGEVRVYTINKPMTWEQFTAMPKDLRQAHLDFVQRFFDVSVSYIGEKEFGLSRNSLNNYARREELRVISRKGGKSSEAMNEFDRWVEGSSNDKKEAEPIEEPTGFNSDPGEMVSPEVSGELTSEVSGELTSEVPTEVIAGDLVGAPDVRKPVSCILRGSADMIGTADQIYRYLAPILCGKTAAVHIEYRFEESSDD